MTKGHGENAWTREQHVPSPDTDAEYHLRCGVCGREWDRRNLLADGEFPQCPNCGAEQLIIVDATLIPKDRT